jgi:hypothetical protein
MSVQHLVDGDAAAWNAGVEIEGADVSALPEAAPSSLLKYRSPMARLAPSLLPQLISEPNRL